MKTDKLARYVFEALQSHGELNPVLVNGNTILLQDDDGENEGMLMPMGTEREA